MMKVRHPLIELTSVRTKEFLRETEAVFWVFGFPILLAVALGFAFRSAPPEKIPVGIAAGPQAPARLAALSQSPALLPRVVGESEGRDMLRRGKISLLIEGDPLIFRFDPTRPEARNARLEANDALQKAAGRRDVLSPKQEFVQEQGARYIDFLVPGLLGMNLMSTGMWGMGFTIVNARMKKLLKRLIATPMRKSQYLWAQFLSRLLFLVAEITILVAFGWIVFGVRVHGSMLLLAVLCLIGGYAFSGIGLLIASRVRTLEGVSGLMNLVMLPMWICSGVFFSYERFPESVKPMIRALPLTALNDALRAVINDGVGFDAVIWQTVILMIWGVASFFVALKIFRWQ